MNSVGVGGTGTDDVDDGGIDEVSGLGDGASGPRGDEAVSLDVGVGRLH